MLGTPNPRCATLAAAIVDALQYGSAIVAHRSIAPNRLTHDMLFLLSCRTVGNGSTHVACYFQINTCMLFPNQHAHQWQIQLSFPFFWAVIVSKEICVHFT
jgi:hypothetical protein